MGVLSYLQSRPVYLHDIRVRVCFFNYTTNQLIDVYLEDGIVTSVALKEPYEHPESPIEVAQAIGLIRSDPNLKTAVEGLEASGILRVPMNPHGPSYKHRCMHIMFTQQSDPHKEMPVLFSALVDLRLQKVIAYSETRWDAVVRKYRPEEDHNWPHPPEQEIYFPVHEYCDNTDIVFWSICHLAHQASEGADHWHSVGPEIVLDLPRIPGTVAQQYRQMIVSGMIHIKDLKVGKPDLWGHFPFNDAININPSRYKGEILVQRDKGDVRVDLILRFERHLDDSVGLNIKASLFDEDDRVASTETNFNVLIDESITVGGLHLKDYHIGDADTTDIDLTVENKLHS